MNKEYKPVYQMEQHYLVSQCGEVIHRSTRQPITDMRRTRTGQWEINLPLGAGGKHPWRGLARLVKVAWDGYHPFKIKLKDGNPNNYHYDNIEWSTTPIHATQMMTSKMSQRIAELPVLHLIELQQEIGRELKRRLSK